MPHYSQVSEGVGASWGFALSIKQIPHPFGDDKSVQTPPLPPVGGGGGGGVRHNDRRIIAVQCNIITIITW